MKEFVEEYSLILSYDKDGLSVQLFNNTGIATVVTMCFCPFCGARVQYHEITKDETKCE